MKRGCFFCNEIGRDNHHIVDGPECIDHLAEWNSGREEEITAAIEENTKRLIATQHSKAGATVQRILEVMPPGKHMSSHEVAVLINMSPSNTRRFMNRMYRKGLLHRALMRCLVFWVPDAS